MNLQQFKAMKDVDLVIPSFFGTEYPFQRIGTAAITVTERILLGDETGLGKTVETVAAVALLKDRNEISNQSVLVICQNSMKNEWKDTFTKFTALHPIVGDVEDKNCRYLNAKFNALVLGYPTVQRRWELLEKHPFQMIIIDEASLIKNHESKTYKAVKVLTNKAKRVCLLNATTLENNLTEVYSMIDLLYPGTIGTYQEFLDRYCEVERKFFKTKWKTLKEYQKITGAKSIELLNEVKEKMTPFYFRRTYDEVGMQLPERVVQNIRVELKPEQKKAYTDAIAEFRNGKVKGASLLHNLLRICDGKQNWSKDDDPTTTSAKGEVIEDLIESFGNSQFVIFSQYIDPLLACGKICKKLGKRAGFYTGKNAETREAHKEEFKRGERDVLLVSKAAIRGLNLENCQYMIKVNQLYNPSANWQLESRIRRITSTYKNVHIFNLIAQDTVEERVVELLTNKKELSNYINDVGDDEEDSFKSLTPEQIERLLSKRPSLIESSSLDTSVSALSQ